MLPLLMLNIVHYQLIRVHLRITDLKNYWHNKNALGAFVDNKKNLQLSKISLDTFDDIKMSQNFFI